MRRKLVVGNWKMHGNRAGIADLLAALQRSLASLGSVDVAVCPPFVYLPAVQQQLAAGSGAFRIGLGAQNLHAEEQGAFTGEVAAAMLRDCGCDYAIVGHSERRQLFGESDAQVAEKTLAALRHDLTPLVCVGETLAERESDATLAVIARQLDAVLQRVNTADTRRLVFAYEPVWAIGTGRTATPEQAQAVHAFIRERLASFGAAETAKILYGGSVKASNAAALFAKPDIDGALVGGASLNAEEFAAICAAAE